MIPPQLPDPGTQLDAFQMSGGLDLVTPAVSVPSGTLLACQNYEPDLNGGYRRAGEYERFDGRPRPSQATFYSLACTVTGTISAGDTVVVGAASGTYVKALTGGILLVNPTGTFTGSTAMTVSAVNVGTTDADPRLPYGDLISEEAQALADCADELRGNITAVPGTGDVWGVFMYAGKVYAIRNDVAPATTATLYESSSGGWVAVTLPYEMTFTTSGTTPFVEGETITGGTSGRTAVVRRVVMQTGDWGTTPAGTGRLIVTAPSGAFTIGETITGGTSTGTAVVNSNATQITLNQNGRLKTVEYSFAGQAQAVRVYGADGVNRPWEFDGTYLVPLDPGISGVYPSHVCANRNYLFLAYGSSILWSEVGEPYRWQATLGAGELAVGSSVSNLIVLPGESVGIFTRNKTQALVGASPSEWSLQTIAADVGAVAYTVQTAMDTYALDDRGIMSVSASDKYGNFAFASSSRRIQPLINSLRNTFVDSCVVREKGLYRLFAQDGSVISMLPGEQPSFGSLFLNINPVCVWSGEDTTGAERIFVGAEDGFVYELDVGTSQDGDPVEAFLRTHYTNQQSPRTRKRYRKLALDVKPDRYMTIKMSGELTFGDTSVGSIPSSDVTSTGSGGFWDISNWDEFFWDGRDFDQPEVRLYGVGINLSISVYQNTVLDAGHVIQSGLVHFSPRRMKR